LSKTFQDAFGIVDQGKTAEGSNTLGAARSRYPENPVPGQPAEQLFQLRAVMLWPVERHQQGLFDPEPARKIGAASLLECGPVRIQEEPLQVPIRSPGFITGLEEMLDLTKYAARDSADADEQGRRGKALEENLRRDPTRPRSRPRLGLGRNASLQSRRVWGAQNSVSQVERPEHWLERR